MCIRDRLINVAKARGIKGVHICHVDAMPVPQLELTELDSETAYAEVPVSYTHLITVNRNHINRDIFVVKILIIVVNLVNIFKVLCRSACVLKCPVTVSYTHLLFSDYVE